MSTALPKATAAQRQAARLYALIHRGNPGDVEFYVDACAGARRVLELGCGEGRVLEALLAGTEAALVGLDLDAGALAEALERPSVAEASASGRLTLQQGDMRQLDLEGAFDRIIIPYNGLYTLQSLEGVRRCLSAAAAHLSPGGLLIFDGYAVDDDAADAELFVDPPDPADAEEDPWCAGGYEYLITVLDQTQRVDVYEREEAVGAPRRLNAHYRFVIYRDLDGEPEIVEQAIGHHFITPGMVPPLLEAAGLKLDGLWGDFDRRPFTEEDERLLVQAVKPSE